MPGGLEVAGVGDRLENAVAFAHHGEPTGRPMIPINSVTKATCTASDATK